MILTREQILGYCEKPPNAALVHRAQALYKAHALHVKGIGLDEFLYKIEGYENQAQHSLRQKLAKTATVPVFAKETDTFSKIFTAQGFSRYYQFTPGTQERLESDLKQYLLNVGEGLSMNQWMRDVWSDKVNYESCGLLMVELPEQGNGIIAEPYLTFKSVTDFRDIQMTGNKVEYVIFFKEIYDEKQKETYTQFRVIDDTGDYIVEMRKGIYLLIEEESLPNPWKYVPAVMVSNQRDCKSNAHTTYIWKSIDIANEYLLDASIHTISKKLHGFPMRWMRQRACRKCQAKGQINTGMFMPDNITPQMINCNDCGGTGVAIKTDVSEVILIPQMEGKEDVDNLPVAGYVVPDIDSLVNQNEEQKILAEKIHMGIWADPDANISQSSAPESATGRILDVQSINAKLLLVSENAEEVERFLTQTIAKVRYGTDYTGSIINYGKKYFIRSVDDVEVMYQKAKASGMATHILDAYIEEIVYLKFSNDPLELKRQLMLNTIEPFIHLSPKELQTLGVPLPDYFMKLYFTDYIERYESQVKPIILSTQEEIIAKLIEYNNIKVAESKKQTAEENAAKAATNSPIV